MGGSMKHDFSYSVLQFTTYHFHGRKYHLGESTSAPGPTVWVHGSCSKTIGFGYAAVVGVMGDISTFETHFDGLLGNVNSVVWNPDDLHPNAARFYLPVVFGVYMYQYRWTNPLAFPPSFWLICLTTWTVMRTHHVSWLKPTSFFNPQSCFFAISLTLDYLTAWHGQASRVALRAVRGPSPWCRQHLFDVSMILDKCSLSSEQKIVFPLHELPRNSYKFQNGGGDLPEFLDSHVHQGRNSTGLCSFRGHWKP